MAVLMTEKRKKTKTKKKLTDVSSLVDIPEGSGPSIAVGGDARVVEADDGDAGLEVGLVVHAADVDDDGGGLGARGARRQRQRGAELARLAARRHLDVHRVPAARGLDGLEAVVGVITVPATATTNIRIDD